MRLKQPSKIILIRRIDPDASYRRIHANTQISPTCIVIAGRLSILCLCFPFGNTTVTIRIHNHEWGRKRPRKWSPHGNIMGCNRPPINSQTLTPRGGLRTYFRLASKSGHNSGGCGIKGILNEWIHRQQHHPHHGWLNVGGTSLKFGITDDPHHIPETSDPRTDNLEHPPIAPQTSRVRVPCRVQDVSGMGHPDPLTTYIPTQIKVSGLGKWHQGVPNLNKNKNGQTGIPHWQARSPPPPPPQPPQNGTSSQDNAIR